MRYRITLSYDGSEFCGWQVQPNAPSVQAALEDALARLLGTEVEVTGAGRTDSGVHAVGYVAHFDTFAAIDTEQVRFRLNAILPRSMSVSGLEEATDDFHARFGATRREYTYFLHTGKDPFCGRYSYRCHYALDVDAMNEAASAMLGRHDFSCFEKIGADNKTSICTVFEAGWHDYVPTHVGLMGQPAEGRYLYFRIAADRFLRNMVRATVGTLLDVGRGRRTPQEFAGLLDCGGTRCDAGESVPGHALFLSKVLY